MPSSEAVCCARDSFKKIVLDRPLSVSLSLFHSVSPGPAQCKHIIANTPGGMPTLVALLGSSSAATRGHAAGILSQLASIKEYALAMKDMAPQCPWLYQNSVV